MLLSLMAPAKMLAAVTTFLEFVPGVFATGGVAHKNCDERRGGRDPVVAPEYFFLFVRERNQRG